MKNKKTKHYFIRIAILKTIISGTIYLILPFFAKLYFRVMNGEYIGYTVAGGIIFSILSCIILIRAWAIALDKETREKYLQED